MAKFRVTTVETVYRAYDIEAENGDQAHERLKLYWKDPEMMREGIVERLDDETVKNRMYKSAEAAPAPAPAEEPSAAAKPTQPAPKADTNK